MVVLVTYLRRVPVRLLRLMGLRVGVTIARGWGAVKMTLATVAVVPRVLCAGVLAVVGVISRVPRSIAVGTHTGLPLSLIHI